MSLSPHDVVAPVHRDLGAHLVRGTTVRTVMQHYFGRADGPPGGRDGDIHMGEWSRGVFPMVSHLPDSLAGAVRGGAWLHGWPATDGSRSPSAATAPPPPARGTRP